VAEVEATAIAVASKSFFAFMARGSDPMVGPISDP
jgi:hypothetical protein